MPYNDGSYEDDEFWGLVQSDTPVLLGFWQQRCAPCKVMAPVFERLGKRFKGRMEFVAVNVSDRPDVARRFGVSSTPTFIVTKRHKALRHMYGVIHEARMAEQIEAYALPTPTAAADDTRRWTFGWFFRGASDENTR